MSEIKVTNLTDEHERWIYAKHVLTRVNDIPQGCGWSDLVDPLGYPLSNVLSEHTVSLLFPRQAYDSPKKHIIENDIKLGHIADRSGDSHGFVALGNMKRITEDKTIPYEPIITVETLTFHTPTFSIKSLLDEIIKVYEIDPSSMRYFKPLQPPKNKRRLTDRIRRNGAVGDNHKKVSVIGDATLAKLPNDHVSSAHGSLIAYETYEKLIG